MAGAKVNLLDSKGQIINTFITGNDGAYTFDVDNADAYVLNGEKPKYFDGKNKAVVTEESDVVTSDVVLEKDPGFFLYCRFYGGCASLS